MCILGNTFPCVDSPPGLGEALRALTQLCGLQGMWCAHLCPHWSSSHNPTPNPLSFVLLPSPTAHLSADAGGFTFHIHWAPTPSHQPPAGASPGCLAPGGSPSFHSSPALFSAGSNQVQRGNSMGEGSGAWEGGEALAGEPWRELRPQGPDHQPWKVGSCLEGGGEQL